MLITRDLVASLNPCDEYDVEKRAELIPESGVYICDSLPVLLGLPHCDCRWLLARLLPVPQRVLWAKACAERAIGYADKARGAEAEWAEWAAEWATETAAEWAAAAAEWAATAAEWAAELAAEWAATEHKLAVEHAVALLCEVPHAR